MGSDSNMFLFFWRNGFGIDIEIVQTLPVWVSPEEDSIEAGAFYGVVVTLPFCKLLYGHFI
jgi:hypothetical protein